MIRVLVVDDHQAIAKGLGELIQDEADITVAGIAHDPDSARDLIERTSPDVVICDVGLRTTADGLNLLTEHRKQVGFIMLSAHTLPSYVVTAVTAGARGYLSKMASIEDIVAAVRVVASGGVAFSDVAREAIRTSLPTPTPQERALVGLLAQGRSYAEIARRLSLRDRTVEGHLRRLFIRYTVTNRVALVRLAREQGWLEEAL